MRVPARRRRAAADRADLRRGTLGYPHYL